MAVQYKIGDARLLHHDRCGPDCDGRRCGARPVAALITAFRRFCLRMGVRLEHYPGARKVLAGDFYDLHGRPRHEWSTLLLAAFGNQWVRAVPRRGHGLRYGARSSAQITWSEEEMRRRAGLLRGFVEEERALIAELFLTLEAGREP